MTPAERQRKHREKPFEASSQNWLDAAKTVSAGLLTMAWIMEEHGQDARVLVDLEDKFSDIEATAYDDMWPENRPDNFEGRRSPD
jgi:hypothetical protein